MPHLLHFASLQIRIQFKMLPPTHCNWWGGRGEGVGANSVNNGGVGKWTSHATPEDLSTLLITLPKKFLHWACWSLLHSWLKVYQIISFFALSGWMCLGSFIVAILFDGFQFKICKTKSMLFNIFWELLVNLYLACESLHQEPFLFNMVSINFALKPNTTSKCSVST